MILALSNPSPKDPQRRTVKTGLLCVHDLEPLTTARTVLLMVGTADMLDVSKRPHSAREETNNYE